jgi:hypothetical protein
MLIFGNVLEQGCQVYRAYIGLSSSNCSTLRVFDFLDHGQSWLCRFSTHQFLCRIARISLRSHMHVRTMQFIFLGILPARVVDSSSHGGCSLVVVLKTPSCRFGNKFLCTSQKGLSKRAARQNGQKQAGGGGWWPMEEGWDRACMRERSMRATECGSCGMGWQGRARSMRLCAVVSCAPRDDLACRESQRPRGLSSRW